MDLDFPLILDNLRKKSKENHLLSQIRRHLPDRTRKQTQIDPNEYFPALPDLPIPVPEERTRADSETENSKLDKSSNNRSTRSRKNDSPNNNDKQELEPTNEREASANVSKKSKKRPSSANTNKKQLDDIVYHFTPTSTADIQEVIEELKENRKSLQLRNSLAKRKLELDEEAVASNSSKSTHQHEEVKTTTPVLSASSSSKLNINSSSNNKQQKQMMPPPSAPPLKSNSEIVITKMTNPDFLLEKRKSMVINVLQTLSPIVSLNESNKKATNRQIHDIRQLQSQQILNDDSKDETELILSQTQKFLRKSSIRGNNTTQGTTTSRLSIGSTPSESNPFQVRSTPSETVDESDNNEKRKKKRKISPIRGKNATPLSSTHIAEAVPSKSKSKTKKNKKRINNSLESEDESEEDEEVPNKKPSKNNRRKKGAAEKKKTSAIVVVDEPAVPSILKSKAKSKIPVITPTTKKTTATIPVVIEETPPPVQQKEVPKKLRSADRKTTVSIPAPVIEEEIEEAAEPIVDIILETQENPAVEEIEAVVESPPKATKKKKATTAKKAKQAAPSPKSPTVYPVEAAPEQDDGLRRSRRNRAKTHSNLKPIYATDFVDDAYGKRKIPTQTIVGYEKIESDLTRFREKFLRDNYAKKTKPEKKRKVAAAEEAPSDSNGDEEPQTQKKTTATKNAKRSKKGELQRPRSDDDDEEEPVPPKKPKRKNKKREASVDNISVVIENEEDGMEQPMADINNNSQNQDLNNNRAESRSMESLFSQSFYQHLDGCNVDQEVIPVEYDANKEKLKHHCVMFSNKNKDREYSELTKGVRAAATDPLGGVVCIDSKMRTFENGHDSNIVYFIQSGHVHLNMCDTKTALKVGDSFTVPKECLYSIENPSESKKAYLLFRFEKL